MCETEIVHQQQAMSKLKKKLPTNVDQKRPHLNSLNFRTVEQGVHLFVSFCLHFAFHYTEANKDLFLCENESDFNAPLTASKDIIYKFSVLFHGIIKHSLKLVKI